ncbi:hypothetical protein PFNF54_01303 [Plasmodium falciparum NF54]|uniref:Rifin n=1 Tax=Plasmodium falciparum (isolate NF54) TaxID=5843 RepID=W7JZ51_PLAFO|nr:hypothetical protein PFNF54_01303 [Plasmodium falciparum NF54]
MHDFDRQTSQRFEEYNERMNKNRQKCREQCDKDIQEIIAKDKIQKSLAVKVEKGCLRCGCGLGGVAAGVGIFGALGTYGWKIAATAMAYETAKQAVIQAGIDAAIAQIKIKHIFKALSNITLSNFINESNYNTIDGLFNAIMNAIHSTKNTCPNYNGPMYRVCNGIVTARNTWLDDIVEAGTKASVEKITAVEADELVKVTATVSNAYSAIGYSVTVILIIVLVMIIIYLILLYGRKKKMNKKLQYTKLLNQ